MRSHNQPPNRHYQPNNSRAVVCDPFSQVPAQSFESRFHLSNPIRPQNQLQNSARTQHPTIRNMPTASVASPNRAFLNAQQTPPYLNPVQGIRQPVMREQNQSQLPIRAEPRAKVEKLDFICFASLTGECPKTIETCTLYHPPYKTTFVWQFRSLSDEGWSCFDKSENELLETEFCDPKNEKGQINCDGLIVYDFEEMVVTRYYANYDERRDKLRRIETQSKFRTSWNYYWKNINNEWKIFYKSNNNEGISCDELDRVFTSATLNETKVKVFTLHGKEFFIHMLRESNEKWKLHETDSNLKMRSQVRRRPRKNKVSIK